MNNKLTISPQLPQRWITEITPDGVIRHVQRISSDHIIILPDDLPGLLSDRLLVTESVAASTLDALLRRCG